MGRQTRYFAIDFVFLTQKDVYYKAAKLIFIVESADGTSNRYKEDKNGFGMRLAATRNQFGEVSTNGFMKYPSYYHGAADLALYFASFGQTLESSVNGQDIAVQAVQIANWLIQHQYVVGNTGAYGVITTVKNVMSMKDTRVNVYISIGFAVAALYALIRYLPKLLKGGIKWPKFLKSRRNW